MGEIRSYKDLTVWQKAREFVKKIYVVSKGFSREETYGLTQQIRRAAISVPSNIAEGYGRGSRKDYVRFLHMARGSLYELETQLFLAQDMEYLSPATSEPILGAVADCSRLLNGLIASLQRDA